MFFKPKVRHLLRGQEKLDRMKADIHETISIIVRLAHSEYDFGEWGGETGNVTCKSRRCLWSLTLSKDGDFRLSCFELNRNGTKKSEALRLYSGNAPETTSRDLTLDQVEHVYDDLPTFMKEVFRQFPRVAKRARPFISAGRKRL